MSSSQRVIAITGATGTNGQQVAAALAQYPELRARLVVRDTAKAAHLSKYGEVVKGDLTDEASLESAFAGAWGLFLLTPFVQDAESQARNALAAAKKVGSIKFVVYLSAIGSTLDSPLWVSRDHAKKEQLVKESGLQYTILQPTFFQSNLVNFNRPTLQSQGVFYGSSGGEKRYPPIDPEDIAEVTAKVFSTPEKYQGQTLVLTGPEAVNDHELAAIASKAWGKEIKYIDVEPDAYRKSLDSYGMPEWQASSLNGLQQLVRAGYTAEISPAVQDVLGRPGRTPAEYLKLHPL